MKKFGLDEEIILNIVEIIKKYEEIECAKIFGSRARNDYRANSDIDIALFGDKITHQINTQIYYEIDNLYLPYKIDLINFNSLGDKNNIKDNILNEGVNIYVK